MATTSVRTPAPCSRLSHGRWHGRSNLRDCATLLVMVSVSVATVWTAAGDDQLIDAVKRSDLGAVRAVLDRDRNPDASEPDGTRALHWAVLNDDLQTANVLIGAGATANAVNRYGVTPLHLACTNGSPRMLAALLDAGADVDAPLPAGETALMTCARTGSSAALEVLVEHGANVSTVEDWRGQTALMWAAAQGHAAAVRSLLDHGADLHARSTTIEPPNSYMNASGGFTPLLFAVREGHIRTAEVLVDAGASPNDADPNGTSALILAILNGHFELAAVLLDRGADPDVPDESHGSALHTLAWVRRQAPGIGMGSASMYPRIPTGNMDGLTLGEKLLAAGANPNVRFTTEDPKYEQGADGNTFYYVSNPPDFALSVSTLNWDGATPFWLAAKNADVPLMRLLVAHGADPHMPNRVNVTPLMAAAGAGFMQGESPGTEAEALEATRLALELGNDVNARAHFAADEERADLRFSGTTALHGAAQRGANAIVHLLVERGARLDVETSEGWTPFNVADGIQIGGTFKNYPETADLLRQLMADRGLPVEEIRFDNFVAAGEEAPAAPREILPR